MADKLPPIHQLSLVLPYAQLRPALQLVILTGAVSSLHQRRQQQDVSRVLSDQRKSGECEKIVRKFDKVAH